MTNDIDDQLQNATTHLERELDDLRAGQPAARGEAIAWVGGPGRGRWLLLSWSDGRSSAESPALSLSIWSDGGYGVKYPIKNAAFTMKLAEIPAFAKAVLAVLVRGKAAAIDRGERDRRFRAERAGGTR